jgi:hypothetical protein
MRRRAGVLTGASFGFGKGVLLAVLRLEDRFEILPQLLI